MTAQRSHNYTKKETERRRDEALKRALNTPPKPHKKSESGQVEVYKSKKMRVKKT